MGDRSPIPSTQAPRAPRRSRAARDLGVKARLRKYRGREDSNLHQWNAHEKRAKTNGLNIKYNQQTIYKHGIWMGKHMLSDYLDLFGSLGYPQLGFHFSVTCTFENCTSTQGRRANPWEMIGWDADTKMQWLTSSEEQPGKRCSMSFKNQELSFQHSLNVSHT